MKAKIRKLIVSVEETRQDMGKAVEPPTRKAAAVAVIENPFAGQYAQELKPLMDIGEELGELLTRRCVAALGIDGGKAESYGKAMEKGGALVVAEAGDDKAEGGHHHAADQHRRVARAALALVADRDDQQREADDHCEGAEDDEAGHHWPALAFIASSSPALGRYSMKPSACTAMIAPATNRSTAPWLP